MQWVLSPNRRLSPLLPIVIVIEHKMTFSGHIYFLTYLPHLSPRRDTPCSLGARWPTILVQPLGEDPSGPEGQSVFSPR